MARMHGRARGKAKSQRPMGRPVPDNTPDAKEIVKLITQYRKENLSAALIGERLRDDHGVLDVKAATGKRISAHLAEAGASGELPDDLLDLARRAVLIRKHLVANKHDETAKRGLRLTESKVLRLAKYYKANGKLAATWKYNPQALSYLGE